MSLEYWKDKDSTTTWKQYSTVDGQHYCYTCGKVMLYVSHLCPRCELSVCSLACAGGPELHIPCPDCQDPS